MLRFSALFLCCCLSGRLAAAAAGPAVRPPDGEQPVIAKLLDEAHTLQADYHESEALAKYEQILGRDARHYEALWQAALLSLHIGNRYTDETRRSAYYVAARQYADRALAVQPNGAEANYAVAQTLVTRATLLNARGRLYAYKEIKPYVFKAVKECPEWAETWQLLGRWHYRVDHYNILERLFSRFFLGGMPSGASSRKAIAALERAHALEPNRIQFCYDLARVYRNQKQFGNSRRLLEQAVLIQPTTGEELEISRSCRNLLQQLQRRNQRHQKKK